MKRPLLIFQTTVVLFLCAVGVSMSHLWRVGPITGETAQTLIVPVISTLLFVCLSLSIPDLYAVERLKLPVTLTLPLIYTSSLLLTVTLITRVGLSVMKMPAGPSIDVWANLRILGIVFFGGFVCLSVLGILERDAKESVES